MCVLQPIGRQAGTHSRQVARQSQGTFTHTIQSPISLKFMLFDLWEESGVPEEICTDTWRMCKLHREKLGNELNTGPS